MKIPEPKKISNGVWEIVNTVVEELGVDDNGTYEVRRAAIHMGGLAHRRTHSLTVKALYEEDGLDAVDQALNALAARKSPATVLTCGASGNVDAREGRLLQGDQGLALMQKGSSSKGHYINERFRPLDVAAGYGKAHAIAESWWVHAAAVPEVKAVDYEGIPEESDMPEELIMAAYLLNYPDFAGGMVPGCMFLATDHHDGVVNGFLWAPEDCPVTSEHGSQYMARMKDMGGRITNFTPGQLTFAHCMDDDIPGTRREAYAYVLGNRA